ncbi:MAG: MBL fold metallo-hydrolase, partial [Myxococcaceae bacterium]|nr:MBL fold metallo-hydrolase [Myxococcaceae bacterium]
RGSVAVSGPHVARVGGNTSCIEVTSQGERLILDAGTGLRGLGEALAASGPQRATFLFSHLHWDHVQGFPFFAPAWHPGSELTLYGPGDGGDAQLRNVLDQQMTAPTFPVPLSAMKSRLHFGAARPAVAFEAGPFRITPFEVPHPQGCLSYRVEADGAAFVYMTDVELKADALPKLGRFIEGADALVLDAQYTPDEYAGRVGPPKAGWGHSTMIDAALLARGANVKRFFMFHHDPAHNDDFMAGMETDARDVFEPTELAREGLTLEVA